METIAAAVVLSVLISTIVTIVLIRKIATRYFEIVDGYVESVADSTKELVKFTKGEIAERAKRQDEKIEILIKNETKNTEKLREVLGETEKEVNAASEALLSRIEELRLGIIKSVIEELKQNHQDRF